MYMTTTVTHTHTHTHTQKDYITTAFYPDFPVSG